MEKKIQKSYEIDMCNGPLLGKIMLFTLPLMLSGILQLLFNAADVVVVGRFAGNEALAAVGSTGALTNLLVNLFIGMSVGANVLVARYYGGKQEEEVSRTVHTSMLVSAAGGVILAVLGIVLAKPLLLLMDTPDNVINHSVLYMRIYFLGMPVMLIFNFGSAILRAVGDTRRPLFYLMIAGVINVALNLWFVIGFHMGVAGVALATVIAQAISAFLCLLRLMKMKEYFDLKPGYLKPQRKYTRKIIKLGLPSGITQAILSMAMIVVQSLTNSFGEMFIAANVIVMRVDGFAMMPNFSFGTAMTTYAGQNVGARRNDRVDRGAKQGTLIAVVTSTVITGMILLFGKLLMGIFTNTPELVDLSRDMMGILAVGYIAMAVTQSLSGVMRGAGDTMTPMWISIATTIAIRVPIAYGISFFTRTESLPNGRQECIFISLLLSWLIGALITFIFYKRGKWKDKAI